LGAGVTLTKAIVPAEMWAPFLCVTVSGNCQIAVRILLFYLGRDHVFTKQICGQLLGL
jgi:hypothetical protein